ncbi:hypothetical protein DVH24_006072 [Malus domestica]|uniref:Uncharacterized protein n=1 Tax=Malus domestica TaxID=3750 RepID=A0A498J463_MALDO|nr:hypothetical protein DVH24_006072 [Malus domestica]
MHICISLFTKTQPRGTVDDQWADGFAPRFFLRLPCCFLLCTVKWLFCPFGPRVDHRSILHFNRTFSIFLLVSATLSYLSSVVLEPALSSTVLELAFSCCHFLVSHGFRLAAHLSDHRNHCRSSLYFDCILLVFVMLSLMGSIFSDFVLLLALVFRRSSSQGNFSVKRRCRGLKPRNRSNCGRITLETVGAICARIKGFINNQRNIENGYPSEVVVNISQLLFFAVLG